MTSVIEYFHYNNTISANFFIQKKKNLLNKIQQQASMNQANLINSKLSIAQSYLQNLVSGSSVTSKELESAIINSMNTTHNLGSSLEQIGANISGFLVNKQGQLSSNAQVLQSNYIAGYGALSQVIQATQSKKGTIMDIKYLTEILNKCNPSALSATVKQTGTYLGDIGEVAGQILLKNIGDELLNTAFKNVPGVTATVTNVGDKKTLSNLNTVTTDNILVIRGINNKILFSLNLSNKMNAKFMTNAQSTKYPIKIASKKIHRFLAEQKSDKSDWEYNIYNMISYHWDSQIKGRRDYYLTRNATSIMRQTVGMQMLYDHIYGTGETFILGNDKIKDKVLLMSYGNKIFASTDVLKSALAKYAQKERFNMARIEMNRGTWFENHGNWQHGKVASDIMTSYDVQKKIGNFNLSYSQTINFY